MSRRCCLAQCMFGWTDCISIWLLIPPCFWIYSTAFLLSIYSIILTPQIGSTNTKIVLPISVRAILYVLHIILYCTHVWYLNCGNNIDSCQYIEFWKTLIKKCIDKKVGFIYLGCNNSPDVFQIQKWLFNFLSDHWASHKSMSVT